MTSFPYKQAKTDSMDSSFGLYNDIQNNVSDYDATINLNQMLEKSACEALYPIIKEKLIRYGIDDEFKITVKMVEKTEGYEIKIISNQHYVKQKNYVFMSLCPKKYCLNVQI